ncbi:Uncharacterised protein [uncultured archaeon]|nr:Uncharacterised protein [uncultured archaeon]
MKNKRDVLGKNELKLFAGFLFLILLICFISAGVIAPTSDEDRTPMHGYLDTYTPTTFVFVLEQKVNGEPMKDIAIKTWSDGKIEDKVRIWSGATADQKAKIYAALPTEESQKFFKEAEGKSDSSGKSVQGDILKSAFKDQFGKNLDVSNLPAGVGLKVEKNKEGKTNSIKLQFTKDGKPNGEVTLNKNVKSISSDIGSVKYNPVKDANGKTTMKSEIVPPKGNLVIGQTVKGGKTQYLDISPGLSLDEKVQLSYEGAKKSINAGFGERDGSFVFELKTGKDGNSLKATMIDNNPQTYNTLADMRNDLSKIPSLLIGDSKSGYSFVQPQGEGGKNGFASFTIDPNGKMTVDDGRVRFAVPKIDYNLADAKTQFIDYSFSVSNGESVSMDRTKDISKDAAFQKSLGANEIFIGKDNYIVVNNNDKTNPVTMNDYAKALEHKIYASGTGDIKYYDAYGNLWMHANGGDVSQWALSKADLNAVSSAGNQRVATGDPNKLPGKDATSGEAGKELAGLVKGVEDALKGVTEEDKGVAASVSAEKGKAVVLLGGDEGAASETPKETTGIETKPSYEVYQDPVGKNMFQGKPDINYVKDSSVADLSKGKVLEVEMTEPSWCPTCAKNVKSDGLYVTGQQAAQLGFQPDPSIAPSKDTYSYPTQLQIQDNKVIAYRVGPDRNDRTNPWIPRN